ncbi:MAG: VWA domain-containing protein [Betaproteobacteria bacterium]|nr:VWA domain-containing protein [Betaproteobacteria bacterium]
MYQLRNFAFQWPLMLWLLILVPLLGIFYMRLLARQRRIAQRFGSLALAGAAPGRMGVLRRHGPAILLLMGLAALIVAIARPQAVIILPTRVDSIILAMDISGSMRATDVKPNRLVAAQNAAKTFIASQPSDVKIGVVSIASTAALAQSPTDKREDVIEAIDRFQLQKGTALGSGVVIALSTLLPDSGIDVDQVIFGRSSSRWPNVWKQAEKREPVPPGSNNTVAIVLLSDGVSNFGPDLAEAGKLAAERGVRVYTVGIGTAQGDTLSVDGWSVRVRLEEEALKKLANMTQGEYFQASNAGELKKIYQQLGARLTLGKGRLTEITALCVALGALLAMFAVLFSLFRFNRVL